MGKKLTRQIVNLKIIKKVKPVKVVNYNINAENCEVISMMQYVHCLHNLLSQSTAICQQIIHVSIEVEYFNDNIIYHNPPSEYFFCKYNARNLVWNQYGRLSSIPFLKSSIPLWHLPYSILKFPFHKMPCWSALAWLVGRRQSVSITSMNESEEHCFVQNWRNRASNTTINNIPWFDSASSHKKYITQVYRLKLQKSLLVPENNWDTWPLAW